MKYRRHLRVSSAAGLALLVVGFLSVLPAAAATLRGRVLDAATGAPIGDGRALVFQQADAAVAAAHIDPADGSFAFTSLEPGETYYLAIDGKDGRDLLVGGDPSCMVVDPASFELPPPFTTCDQTRGRAFVLAADQATDAGEIRLPAEGRIRGKVRLAEGRRGWPSVEIFTPGGDRSYGEQSIDQVGDYDFDVSVPGGGTFYVAGYSAEHLFQIYDHQDCLGDIVTCQALPPAVPITVAPGAIVEGLEFDLLLDRRPCAPSPTNLCLHDGRFTVSNYHRNPHPEQWILSRAGRITEEAGYFTFFDPANVELVVKVLDACQDYGAFWVYATGLTDVPSLLSVRDNWAAKSHRLDSYGGPYRPRADTTTFRTCGIGPPEGWPAARPAAAPGVAAPQPDLAPNGCGSDPITSLCLGDRFKVEAEWETALGERGAGRPQPLTADTGFFHFFSPGNIEVVVKVLNACRSDLNNHYWVFAAGLTDVAATITVTDTVTGEPQYYLSPLGRLFQPIFDLEAFAGCS
jgi:hypothetical protein